MRLERCFGVTLSSSVGRRARDALTSARAHLESRTVMTSTRPRGPISLDMTQLVQAYDNRGEDRRPEAGDQEAGDKPGDKHDHQRSDHEQE